MSSGKTDECELQPHAGSARPARPRQAAWIERSLQDDLILAARQSGLARLLYLAEVAELRRTVGLGLSGPFVSMIAHTVVLGAVMSVVFNEPLQEFLPYFGVSFAVWQTLASALGRMANASERSARYIAFPRLSSLIVYVVDAHDYFVGLIARMLAAILVVAVASPQAFSLANAFMSFVGSAVLILVLLVWSPIVSLALNTARVLRGFLSQIILMMFLVTPVFYSVERFAGHRWIADFNPVFHLLEIVRQPLLKGAIPPVSIGVCGILLLVGLLLLRIVHKRQRLSMVYGWLA